MLKNFLLTLVALGIINALFSYFIKDILKRNGYKINYLITEFFYETKTLKKLVSEHKDYGLILKLYYIVNILLLINLLLVIALIILR